MCGLFETEEQIYWAFIGQQSMTGASILSDNAKRNLFHEIPLKRDGQHQRKLYRS